MLDDTKALLKIPGYFGQNMYNKNSAELYDSPNPTFSFQKYYLCSADTIYRYSEK